MNLARFKLIPRKLKYLHIIPFSHFQNTFQLYHEKFNLSSNHPLEFSGLNQTFFFFFGQHGYSVSPSQILEKVLKQLQWVQINSPILSMVKEKGEQTLERAKKTGRRGTHRGLFIMSEIRHRPELHCLHTD